MGYSKYKRWIKSLQTKSSLALLVTAALLIELTAAVQYWYAKKGIREEVEQRAKSELKVKNLILYHTEDGDPENRKRLYTEEGLRYYSGNLLVPEDLETIMLD